VVGYFVLLEKMVMMVDGIVVGCLGVVLYVVVSELVDDICMVIEDLLFKVLFFFIEWVKFVVEFVGVVGVAVLMLDVLVFELLVVVVFFGGNIDLLLLLCVLCYGMVVVGCYL